MAAKGLLQSLLLSAFLFPLTSHATTFVKGNIDAPSGNNTSFTIKGWACQTERNQSINVHVYSGGRAGLGGRFLTSATANKSSAQGIANACNNSVTTNNRFSINLTQEQIYQHRGREIFVHGISVAGTPNEAIAGSGKYKMPLPPVSNVVGNIDALYQSGSKTFVKGWACQQYLDKPIKIHIFAGGQSGNGTLIKSLTANKSSGTNIASACKATGKTYYFNTEIPASHVTAHAGKAIYIHGISPFKTGNRLISKSGVFKLPKIELTDSIKKAALSDLEEYTFEPFYAGQMKGLEAVNVSKSGNSLELSAKLLERALVRLGGGANSIAIDNFKVVRGRIRVNVATLKDWLGVESESYIKLILSHAGLGPTKKSLNGIVYYEFTHHWVNLGGKDIDPTLKRHSKIEKLNMHDDAGVDTQQSASSVFNGSKRGGNGEFYPDVVQLDELLYENEEGVAEYLNSSNVVYGDYISQRKPVGSLKGYSYSSGLPYEIITREELMTLSSRSDPFSFVPEDYKHKIKIEAVTDGFYGLKNIFINVSEATQKSLFIDYVPSDSTMEAKINGFGGILNSPYTATTTKDSIYLKPRVRLGEETVATSIVSLMAGRTQNLTVSFCLGTVCDSKVEHEISVGGVHAIALDAININPDLIAEAPEQLDTLAKEYASNLLDSRFSGPMLSHLGRLYHRHLDIEADRASSVSGALIYNTINEAIISLNLSTRNEGGKKILSLGSRQIDAPRLKYSVAPTSVDNNFSQAPILFGLGVTASSLEHSLFAKTLGWQTESTMSVLRYAGMNEEPIFVLSKSNFDALKSKLSYDTSTINTFKQAVNSGYLIIAPQGPQTILGRPYTAYIRLHQDTGGGRYMINGVNGGIGMLDDLSLYETNRTLGDYVDSFSNFVPIAGSAVLDGILMGDRNEKLYETTLEMEIADASSTVTEWVVVGDIRNIAYDLYDFSEGQGSYLNLGVSVIAVLPYGDVAKTGYKYTDKALSAAGLITFKTKLIKVSDKADVIVGNLGRFSDKIISTTTDKLHGISVGITVAKRGDIEFKNITVSDRSGYENAIGKSLGSNPTDQQKGVFTEFAGRDYAQKYLNWECIYCVKDTVPQGVDNIFKDEYGNYIIQETKWISAATNVGSGSLSDWTSNGQKYKQMSEEWIFGVNNRGDNSALSRSNLPTGLLPQLLKARAEGKIRTQLVVMKPKHLGAGVTKGLSSHKQLGANAGLPLNDIVIIELGN